MLKATYVLALAAILTVPSSAADPAIEWTPPDPPDPKSILNEARDDRVAGRYALALQKHVWYHENALKHRPSLAGVRLSFALHDWQQLSNRYPPALAKLEQFREHAEDRVRNNRNDSSAFMDFVALNRTLKEEDRTVSLFKWLDANDPEFAKLAYPIAEDALVAAEEFGLCSRYLVEPEETLKSFVWTLERTRGMAKESPELARSLESQQDIYAHKAALIVAILAKAERHDEAIAIADMAVEEFSSDRQVRKIRDAEKGIVPEPLF